MLTGSGPIDAERAFLREARARRRAALARRLRRQPAACGRLPVFDERRVHRGQAPALGGLGGVREVPLHAITGTLEPSRARLFDAAFRPSPRTRRRWERLWLAEHRGAVLPPVSLVQVGDEFVVRDGHHRVSVARARGATTIDAWVDGAA